MHARLVPNNFFCLLITKVIIVNKRGILVVHYSANQKMIKIDGLLAELFHGVLCVPIQNYQVFMQMFLNTYHG